MISKRLTHSEEADDSADGVDGLRDVHLLASLSCVNESLDGLDVLDLACNLGVIKCLLGELLHHVDLCLGGTLLHESSSVGLGPDSGGYVFAAVVVSELMFVGSLAPPFAPSSATLHTGLSAPSGRFGSPLFTRSEVSGVSCCCAFLGLCGRFLGLCERFGDLFLVVPGEAEALGGQDAKLSVLLG